jgi:signal transduction histidine kinase
VTTPIEPQSPAEFRHRLLTPVNQILGYAELLIEDAEAESQADLLAALRSIHAEGHRIFEAIRAATAVEEAVPPDFPAQLAGMSGRIIAECDRLAPDHERARDDLLKIRRSAAELIGLATGAEDSPG